MKITPRIKGFICLTAHPEGCAKNVDDAIAFVKSKGAIKNGCKSALIIGSSTGYGLASRIVASFGCGADTVGVFFERGPDVERERPASAGWYNTAAFTRRAREAGLYAANINGDAFSDEVKQKATDKLRRFSRVASFSLDINSPFFWSALLWDEDAPKDQPDNLQLFINELKSTPEA